MLPALVFLIICVIYVVYFEIDMIVPYVKQRKEHDFDPVTDLEEVWKFFDFLFIVVSILSILLLGKWQIETNTW